MPSVFTPFLEGQRDARMLWRDEACIAIHATEPLREGHAIVVPRREVDHWIDLDDATAAHLMSVARVVGQAVQRAFRPEKVGLFILGLKVRHVHLHLVPVRRAADLTEPGPQPVDAVNAAAWIRRELRTLGAPHVTED